MPAICILGMHRSGTSMIARLLNASGLYLGTEERLMQSQSSDNPEGYWENLDFVDLNDKILRLLNSSWDIPPHLSPGWSRAEHLHEARQSARHLIASMDEQTTYWGWKDPRTMLTLELWQGQIPGLKAVICLRNPVEVALSLSRRGASGAEFAAALRLWHTYHQTALASLTPGAYIVTHYSAYFYDSQAELRRVLDFIGLPPGLIAEATATISSSLYRNYLPDHLLPDYPDMTDEVTALYRQLCAVAGPQYQQLNSDIAYQARLMETHLIHLTQDVRQIMGMLNHKLAEEKGLLAKNTRLEAELIQLEAQFKDQIEAAQAENRQITQQVDFLSAELLAITTTRSWQLIQRWYRLKERLLPTGSRRLRGYHLLRTSADLLARDGAGAFAGRLTRWLKGERRYHRAAVEQVIDDEPPQITLPNLSQFSVLFVATQAESVSKRYRAYNLCEQLRGAGLRSEVIFDTQVNDLIEDALTYNIIVFNRIPISPAIARLLPLARERGIVTVFESDDYVFDSDIVPYVDAIRDWSESALASYHNGIRLYNQFLREADFFLGTTQTLVDGAAKFDRPGYIIRNGLNQRQLELAEAALRKQRQPADDVILIGYLPGTATHNQDFAQAVPALARILADYLQTRLVIRGLLDVIPAELRPFEARIEQLPFISWEELVDATAELDINIAPLEPDNPYTNAKSALKYFEAALVKVPTVASPTEDFVRAIRHGENGFLAADDETWYASLKALITDAALRQRMGEAARADALACYAPQAQSAETVRVFQDMLRRHYDLSPDGLTVNWVVIRPLPGSGGFRNILNAAEVLHDQGHCVRIYMVNDGYFRSSEAVRDFIHREFLPSPVTFVLGTEAITFCDALIATHCTTAPIVHSHAHKARRCYYFVQDFEPWFFESKAGYQQAEATYRLGLQHITLGPWLTKVLREQYAAQADYFYMPIDHELYKPAPDQTHTPQRVIFLARPEMPRRRYELGIDALALLARMHPDVEIVLFGSEQINSAEVPFPHTNLKVIKDLRELAALYTSATVGVVFSTTNPSLMPLEMLACGCPVVELDNEINLVHYGGREVVTLAAPEPPAIAQAINALLTDEALRQERVRRGLDFAQRLPGLEESGRQVEQLIHAGLAGR